MERLLRAADDLCRGVQDALPRWPMVPGKSGRMRDGLGTAHATTDLSDSGAFFHRILTVCCDSQEKKGRLHASCQ